MTTKAPYRKLLNGRDELLEQIHFMQNHVDVFNIYDMFDKDDGIHTMDEYSKKVREMITSDQAKITPTDITSKFEVVFDRQDITGFLLQYEGETNRPNFYDKLTVYETTNPLDVSVIADVIKSNSINAVMISSSERTTRLLEYLITHNITHPITFIIGRYAYNFHMNDGKCEYPLFNREFGISEIRFKHEFGFFDPYSGITTSYRLREESASTYHNSETVE